MLSSDMSQYVLSENPQDSHGAREFPADMLPLCTLDYRNRLNQVWGPIW
jgi:hypothetical protein